MPKKAVPWHALAQRDIAAGGVLADELTHKQTTGGMLEALRRWSDGLDDFVRHLDFRSSRTKGGRLDSWLGIDRHTMSALLLPTALTFLLLAASPTSGWRLGIAAAVGLLVAIGLTLLMRLWSQRQAALKFDLFAQVGVVLVIAAGLAIWGPRQFQERDLYLHLFVPLAAALALVLVVAALIAGPLFSYARSKSDYDEYLSKTELFQSRGLAPEVTPGTILTSALTVPFRAPLVLLTPPALVTLFTPPAWAKLIPGIVFCVWLVILFFAGLNERLGSAWLRAQSVLFRGGALLVALAVIVLAALRWFDVSYATTILDTAAWQTIAAALASAYVLSWWYDYWTHRLLADQVLQMVGGQPGAVSVPYSIYESARSTSVPAAGRVLQVHGSSRFVVLNVTPKVTYFQSHTIQELIDRLADSGAPGGKAEPTPAQVAGRITNLHVITAVLFGGILVGAFFYFNKGEQSPEAIVETTREGKVLKDFVTGGVGESADNPLIVVAASGGGTRAAVYTAAVLEGLAKANKSQNVVIASGVSGGGAALAYFAARRGDLVGNDPKSWDLYVDKMKEPFIKDVLERASEWRMVSSGRLGIVLKESFSARWDLPTDRKTFKDIKDIGLILNTSLAGHLELPEQTPKHIPLSTVEPKEREARTKSTWAGGRLIFTNLQLADDFASDPLEPRAKGHLPIVLRDPVLRLEDAAALNANFPPVFSNAAVDVDRQKRYWVTDGGAVDNRGIEMLLFALRQELKKWPRDTLPHIRLVVADASAFSDKYTQDRGLATVTGAGTRFASHLNAELYQSLVELYGSNKDRLGFTYLLMPQRWRESGSFGTHWMLQTTVRVKVGDEENNDYTTLEGEEMVKVIRALHSGRHEAGLSEKACRVLTESRDTPTYVKHWLPLMASLKATVPAAACPVTKGK